MNSTRRGFLGALLAAPALGWLWKKAPLDVTNSLRGCNGWSEFNLSDDGTELSVIWNGRQVIAGRNKYVTSPEPIYFSRRFDPDAGVWPLPNASNEWWI